MWFKLGETDDWREHESVSDFDKPRELAQRYSGDVSVSQGDRGLYSLGARGPVRRGVVGKTRDYLRSSIPRSAAPRRVLFAIGAVACVVCVTQFSQPSHALEAILQPVTASAGSADDLSAATIDVESAAGANAEATIGAAVRPDDKPAAALTAPAQDAHEQSDAAVVARPNGRDLTATKMATRARRPVRAQQRNKQRRAAPRRKGSVAKRRGGRPLPPKKRAKRGKAQHRGKANAQKRRGTVAARRKAGKNRRGGGAGPRGRRARR